MITGRDTPVVLSAGHYAECGFSVFPLRPASKLPAVKEWQNTLYRFPDEAQEALAGAQGLGVVLSERDLVIDVDPRNFKKGDKPHVRLFEDAGISAKDFGAIARTGSGGMHVYLKLPAGVQVRKKVPNYPGIDFLSKGCFVVGVGSLHPDTQKSYEWALGLPLEGIKEAPESLIRLFRRAGELVDPPGQPGPHLPEGGTTDQDGSVVRAFTEYLEAAPPAIQGESGDAQTFKVCAKGKDYGLSEEKAFELISRIYNPRCSPPWADGELRGKVRNAYAYSQGRVGNALAVSDFSVVEPKKNPLFRGWDLSNGKRAKTLNNAFNYFVMDDSPIKDIIAWDEFNGQVKLLKPAPWTPPAAHIQIGTGVEWRDLDSVMLRLWLGREKRTDFPIQVIEQAVQCAAEQRIVNPVKDFLNGLVWDGVPRIKTWLIDYAKAKDDRYVREVSEKVLLQAVNRIFYPGCKADYVLVLEGNQGIGKSSLIRILAGGYWYADIVVDPHARDTADAMRGKWIVEFSEMEVTKRADANALKAFITRQVDRFRLAYGRRAVDLPRQCIFIGTINPDATNEYLADSTGNRRFWPVRIRQVDFKGLEQVREQLFAEAVHAVKRGDAAHIVDSEVMALAAKEQAKRQTSDPWQEPIQDWLVEQKSDFVTTKEVWIWALRGREADLNLSHQRRIAAALRELGWEQHVRKQDGKPQRGYQLSGSELLG